MTPAEIRALRDAATQGPWQVSYSAGEWAVSASRPICTSTDGSGEDAALIAAAPTLATIAADALDEVARLRKALKPFAAYAKLRGKSSGDDVIAGSYGTDKTVEVKMSDFHRARAALTKVPK